MPIPYARTYVKNAYTQQMRKIHPPPGELERHGLPNCKPRSQDIQTKIYLSDRLTSLSQVIPLTVVVSMVKNRKRKKESEVESHSAILVSRGRGEGSSCHSMEQMKWGGTVADLLRGCLCLICAQYTTNSRGRPQDQLTCFIL